MSQKSRAKVPRLRFQRLLPTCCSSFCRCPLVSSARNALPFVTRRVHLQDKSLRDTCISVRSFVRSSSLFPVLFPLFRGSFRSYVALCVDRSKISREANEISYKIVSRRTCFRYAFDIFIFLILDSIIRLQESTRTF